MVLMLVSEGECDKRSEAHTVNSAFSSTASRLSRGGSDVFFFVAWVWLIYMLITTPGGPAVVDELPSNQHLFLASQGFATEKLSAKSLSLNCVALDFSGVQVHNNHVRERMLFWRSTKD